MLNKPEIPATVVIFFHSDCTFGHRTMRAARKCAKRYLHLAELIKVTYQRQGISE